MAWEVSPETKILIAARDAIAAADLHTALGLAEEFTVRHYFHNAAKGGDRPAIGVELFSAEILEGGQALYASSETAWVAEIRIVVDIDLLAQDDAQTAAAITREITGWDHLTTIARAAMRVLLAEDSPMLAVVDDVSPGDLDPDGDSNPDEGRLSASVNVLYRTKFRDPLHLLPPGGNA